MFKIKLVKSAFLDEKNTRQKLANFLVSAERFSMGEECAKFENSFSKKQGRKYSVFVNSGSSANLILIQSLINLGRLNKGDKIGISSLTWSTNLSPLIQLGLQPVALDINLSTLNISPAILEKSLSGLKGLFLTNVLGYSDNIEKIKNICEKNNILFFEDNCESLGSKAFGKLLGNFGLASTFSFFLGHHISTIEGGMVCTDDEDLWHMLVMVRAHGWDRHLSEEKKASLRSDHSVDPFYGSYTFYFPGYNVRPTEINGFLGNIQISFWDEIVTKRESNFRFFNDAISSNPDLIPLKLGHMDMISSFAIPVIAKDAEKRSKYKKLFERESVEIRPIISGNIAKQPIYKKGGHLNSVCPMADFVHENGFYFGNNSEMDQNDLNYIRKLIVNG